MRFKAILSIGLCFILALLLFGNSQAVYSSPSSDTGPEMNVITASDAGGGALSGTELALIILAAVGVFFLILILVAAAA